MKSHSHNKGVIAMTDVKVYYCTEGRMYQIAAFDKVEITRENSAIYFNADQWAEIVKAVQERGCHIEDLRYYRRLGHIDVETSLLAPYNKPDFVCELVTTRGVERITLEEAEKRASGYTQDLTAMRARGALCYRQELDRRPEIAGFCGPMWDSIRSDGTAVLRYESAAVYDMLSR